MASPALEEKVMQYAHARTWNDAFVILRDNHAHLLTPAAVALLQDKLDEAEAGDQSTGGAQWYSGRLYSRLNILQAARAYGLDEAWRGLGPNVPSWTQDKQDNPNWVPHWKTQ